MSTVSVRRAFQPVQQHRPENHLLSGTFHTGPREPGGEDGDDQESKEGPGDGAASVEETGASGLDGAGDASVSG